MKPPSRRRRRGGFTLMEVLLVLVILVALASMAVLAYGPIQENANKKLARAQIDMLKKAVQACKFDTGMYPPNLDVLSEIQPPADLPNPAKWAGPYLEMRAPLDPWGRPYNYQVPGNRNPLTFDVWSLGPNEADDTDDIGNWEQE